MIVTASPAPVSVSSLEIVTCSGQVPAPMQICSPGEAAVTAAPIVAYSGGVAVRFSIPVTLRSALTQATAWAVACG